MFACFYAAEGKNGQYQIDKTKVNQALIPGFVLFPWRYRVSVAKSYAPIQYNQIAQPAPIHYVQPAPVAQPIQYVQPQCEEKNIWKFYFLEKLTKTIIADIAWKPITVPIPVPNFNWHFNSNWGVQPYAAVAASSGAAVAAAPKKATVKVAEVVEEEEDPIEPAEELEAPEAPSAVDTRQAPIQTVQVQAVPVHAASLNYQFGVVKKFGK